MGFQVENVRFVTRPIIDVCKRLAELHSLPRDVESDVLTVFSKSSDEGFAEFVKRRIDAKTDLEVSCPNFGIGTSNKAFIHRLFHGQYNIVDKIQVYVKSLLLPLL